MSAALTGELSTLCLEAEISSGLNVAKALTPIKNAGWDALRVSGHAGATKRTLSSFPFIATHCSWLLGAQAEAYAT